MNHLSYTGMKSVCVLVVGAYCGQFACGNEDDLRDSIRHAWDTRQAGWKTLDCTFREIAISQEHIGSRAEPKDATTRRVRVVFEHTVKIDGDKFSHQRKQISGRRPAHSAHFSHVVFDGIACRKLSVFEEGQPSGVERRVPRENAYKSAILRPLFHCVRPVHAMMGRFALGNARVLSERGNVDGKQCVILRDASDQIIERDLWVTRSDDHVPVRFTSRVRGDVSINIDMQYEGDDLSAWKFDHRNAEGVVQLRSYVKVESFLKNTQIPKKDFVLDSPTNH